MSQLTVPIVAVITGEGNSGGALALGVANTVLMLENAVYSVLSPEGFASILWKDSSKSAEACELMKLTAEDLLAQGVIDGIIPEPAAARTVIRPRRWLLWIRALASALNGLQKISDLSIAGQRYKKFRAMGGNGYVEGN